MQAIDKVKNLEQVDELGYGGNQIPLKWDVKVGSHIFNLVEVLMGRYAFAMKIVQFENSTIDPNMNQVVQV